MEVNGDAIHDDEDSSDHLVSNLDILIFHLLTRSILRQPISTIQTAKQDLQNEDVRMMKFEVSPIQDIYN